MSMGAGAGFASKQGPTIQDNRKAVEKSVGKYLRLKIKGFTSWGECTNTDNYRIKMFGSRVGLMKPYAKSKAIALDQVDIIEIIGEVA